jgi:transposase
MDYKKIYDNFMQDRLDKKPERLQLKKNGDYFEGHHIIPKSKGGTGNSARPNNSPNIVLLTAREHFLAHWILWRIYRDRSTALSFHKMLSINNKQNRVISSKGYEEAKEAFRVTNLGNQHGKGKTRVVSEEQKKRHSELMKGKNVGLLNPSKRDDVRKKISDSLKGRKKSEKHIQNLSISQKNRKKIKCPFCNKFTNQLNANKWHFDYCKLNPNMKHGFVTNFTTNNTYGCKKIIIIETGQIFNSIKDVAAFFTVHPTTITRWIMKKDKVDFYVINNKN